MKGILMTQMIVTPKKYQYFLLVLSWVSFVVGAVVYAFAFQGRLEFVQSNASIRPVALIQVLSEYAVIVMNFAFALFLMLRASNNRIALITAIALMFSIGNIPGTAYYATWYSPIFVLPSAFVFIMGLAFAHTWIASFPDGYFYPRWLVWFVPAFMAWEGFRYWAFFLVADDTTRQFRPLSVLITISLTAIAGYGQYLRYYNESAPEERQQTKWLVLIFFAYCSVIASGAIIRTLSRLYGTPDLIATFEFFISLCILGVNAIGIYMLWRAITRQSLWNVDLTLNRSLVAGGVTLFLMVLFVAVFAILQALLNPMFGENNENISIIIAGLITGITFQPTRERVREFVDRRLFKLRFNLDQLQRKQQKPILENPGAFSGKILDQYELLGVLGAGGMSEIYKGYDDTKGELVAIKILRQNIAQDPGNLERFKQEAKFSFNHPNIIKVYGYGLAQGLHYIALEYIGEKTLKEILKEYGRLPFARVKHFILPLAQALDTAHAQGTIHRDLKPSNIGMRVKSDSSYEAILMDFGIAKVSGASSITGSGAIGTIDYMAPEQITSARQVDHRADIYALGVVLFEILTGSPPFSGNPATVLFGHLQHPAPDPRSLEPSIPINVADAIMIAMAKNPEDRFNSATEFALALLS
jgi:hypothetical protein